MSYVADESLPPVRHLRGKFGHFGGHVGAQYGDPLPSVGYGSAASSQRNSAGWHTPRPDEIPPWTGGGIDWSKVGLTRRDANGGVVFNSNDLNAGLNDTTPSSEGPREAQVSEDMQGDVEQSQVPHIRLHGPEGTQSGGGDAELSTEQSFSAPPPIDRWCIVDIDGEGTTAQHCRELYNNQIFPKDMALEGDVWDVDPQTIHNVWLSMAAENNVAGPSNEADKWAKVERVILASPAKPGDSSGGWNAQLHCTNDEGSDYIVPMTLQVSTKIDADSPNTATMTMTRLDKGHFTVLDTESGGWVSNKTVSVQVSRSEYEWLANPHHRMYTVGMKRQGEPEEDGEPVQSELILFGPPPEGHENMTLSTQWVSYTQSGDEQGPFEVDPNFIMEHPEQYSADGDGDTKMTSEGPY